MKYTKEQVLRIVDSCFHMYASDYRTDAKDNAIEIMKAFDKQNLANGAEQSDSNCNIPLVSNRIFTVVDQDGDLINCWINEADAKKHAEDLKKEHGTYFDVIEQPLF